VFAPGRQAVVIDLLLLALPLALGLVFGVGLVAGETEHGTQRLAWTQGISRARWYLNSLTVATVCALVVTVVELPVAHWWSGLAWVDLPGTLTLGGSRIQPDVFAASGVVPVAYTLFAVALGVLGGAVLRRVPWAAAATTVVYLALATLMVTTVRPTFAPSGFLVDGTTDSAQYAPWPDPPPWNVGYEFRTVAGVGRPASTPSPARVAAICSYLEHPLDVVSCMRKQGIEGGFITQSPSHFWRLQWPEAGLYAALAALLAGLGLVAVRRSQD